MKKFLLLVIFLSLILGTWFRVTNQSSSPTKTSKKPSSPSFHFPSFKRKPITLMAVGDVMLGRYVNVKMLEYKDFKYPFLKTALSTTTADIAFGNLESPIVADCPTTSVGMVFCGRKEAIEGLQFAGFDILSVANNHILNHGQTGKKETIDLLNKAGITSTTEELKIKKVGQTRFGFLAFNLVDYPKADVLTAVKENTSRVDVLIISLHWGNEYEKEPRDWQKTLAHQIIDNGAKIIIGHHPHVTQPTEEYHDGLIFYSLGNFVFDQPWSEETKKGKMAKVVFEGKNVKSFEEIPIYIEDYSQPQIVQ